MKKIVLGVKSDPIEYRYSYEWLFRIMDEEGVPCLQLGTFFELYDLPDEWFLDLRRKAEACGIEIRSVFTAHRELGGFFREEPGWEVVARSNYERLVNVGALLGARNAGSNPGGVLRDQPERKSAGTARYLEHMKGLMHHAYGQGVETLTIEPMSCLAEPPTLPGEIRDMAEELLAYHREHPDTASVGYCSDVSHGYADRDKVVRHSHTELLQAAVPYLAELHLKNTDAIYNATFGFGVAERERGIVELPAIRDLLWHHADAIPCEELAAYLEIGGPKTGRDYTDEHLEGMLRESLRHMKAVFESPRPVAEEVVLEPEHRVLVAPSVMCCDLCNLEASVNRLEQVGVDWLHIDIMDAHFTPNMPLGLEPFKQLRARTALAFDVHLMVDEPDFFVRQAKELGADWVSVHVESCRHLDRTLALIRSLGMRAGAALNPATPLHALDHILERLDYVMLMTVNPGYAGQALVPGAMDKIARCRDYLLANGCDIPIQVDGNVSFENIGPMVAAGADILVAGSSSVFCKSGSLRENMERLHAVAGHGYRQRYEKERHYAGSSTQGA